MAMFSTGQTIRSRAGNQYEIIELLGAGVTAEVYKARRQPVLGLLPNDVDGVVALKILHKGLAKEIEQNFRDEATILGRLTGAANERNPLIAALLPRIIENASLSEQADTRFIAFEYISFPSLDRILADSGPLDEQTALTITSQVLSILDILHTALRKSYTDFQLQNIRWNADTRLVKVIDWNHLSPEERDAPAPRGAADDLARMTAYLYQMVTGAGARLAGESLYQLQLRGGERWDTLTLGTQAIIARCLHLNPQRRFQTAAEFKATADAHLALWGADLQDLKFSLLSVVRPIDTASSEGRQIAPQEVERAQILINMLTRREPDAFEIRRSRAVIEDVVGEVSPAWATGYQDYQRAAYQQAAMTWEEEARALGRVDLRRWVMAAQTGAELGKEVYAGSVRAALERALEEMNAHNWKPAADTLRAIPERQQSPALRALLAEAEAQLAFQQARAAEGASNWREARRAYEDLLRLLPDISYGDAVRDTFGWDEDSLRRAMARSANLAAEGADAALAQRKVRDAFQKDFDAGLAQLIQELQEQPDQPALVELAATTAAERPPEQAQRQLYATLSWARLSPDQYNDLREQWRKAEEQRLVNLANDAIERRDPHGLVERLSDLHAPPPANLLGALREWYRTAVRAGALPLAAQLAEALSRWDNPEEAQQRAADLTDLRQRAAKDSDNWQTTLLQNIQKLRDQRQFSEAERVLAEAAAYYSEDKAFQARLDQLKPEVEWERLLSDARRLLAGQPGLVEVAFAREALEQASKILPSLASDDGQGRQQRLARLEADTMQAVGRLTGEHHLASAEAWLKREPPHFDAAATDCAEAEKRQKAFDPGQQERLRKVQSLLNDSVAYDNLYAFRHWLSEAERALAQDNARAAAPMADFAAGYRAALPSGWGGSLIQDDQRLARVRATLEERSKHPSAADDDRPTPIYVPQPDSLWEKVRKWLPLPLLGLALLLLIALLAGAARTPAVVRGIPTQIAEVNNNVTGARGAVDSLGTSVDNLALALTPSPTLFVSPTVSPTIAPPTSVPTPSPLNLTAATLSTPVRADTPKVFFDLPDLRLGAPAGWQFDLTSQPAVTLLDEEGGKWWLVLKLTDPTGSQTQELPIDRVLIPTDETTATSIDVIWSRNKTAAPLSPGEYRIIFQSTNQTTREERSSAANALTVQSPTLRVTIDTAKEGAALRTAPDWAETAVAADATFAATQEFEVLGQKSAPCAPEVCTWPEAATAVMLSVRPTGQRQTYWLGDYHTIQFAGDTWAADLAALPVIP